MAEFAEVEAATGVRLPWNAWPSIKIEAAKCAVPFAAIVTPLHGGVTTATATVNVLPYPPLRCKTCRAVLNPFCRVDFDAKLWICPFCYQRCHFPPHYASISPTHQPGELYPQCASVEYKMAGERGLPPVFLFLLDTCLIEEELGYLKASLSQALTLVPGNSLVGLITFGAQVHVYELGFLECPKSYLFRGAKDVTKEQILEQLGLTNRAADGLQRGAVAPPVGVIGGIGEGIAASTVNRFLLAAADCEFTLNTLLDELQKDAWPFPSDQRAARCTGTALTVAAGLLGACVPGTGARIMAFVGGPCTVGSGTIVSKELSDPIRSHKDIDKDTVPFYHKAVKFYEGLSKQLMVQGHVLDLFACALDQVSVSVLPRPAPGISIVLLSFWFYGSGFFL